MNKALPFACLLLATCLASGCVHHDPGVADAPVAETEANAGLRVQGELSYRPRIALPPEATARVRLRAGPAPSAAVLAEQRLALDGRQVPIAFDLAAAEADLRPGRVHVLEAAIEVPGQPDWVSAPQALNPAAARQDLGTLWLQRAEDEETAQTLPAELHCGDHRARLWSTGAGVTVIVAGQREALQPVAAASGARYRGEDTEGVVTEYWNKGEQATLRWRGERWPDCELRPRGAAMTAQGNEPGWQLVLDAHTLTLQWDYGRSRLAAVTPVPVLDGGLSSYAVAVGETRLAIAVHEEICSDDMTGMPYPQRVILSLDEQVLRGCGGEPRQLLLGKWLIEEVDGRGLVAGSRPTLQFDAEGRIGGHGSCNSYGGEYALSGEGLGIRDVFSTMMACDDPLMQQEQGIFAILQAVVRFELSADGALLLHAHDGRSLMARR